MNFLLYNKKLMIRFVEDDGVRQAKGLPTGAKVVEEENGTICTV